MYLLFTKEILENTTISVGHDQGVGAGVEVGHVHVDLLVLDPRHWRDLSHEEDEVASVDGEGQAVNNEEEVGPILSGPGTERCGLCLSLLLLVLFLGLLDLLGLLVFGITILLCCLSILSNRLSICLL